MDIQTFASAIAAFVLFPAALRTAAAKASQIMNDAQRAAVYTELRAVYVQYEEVERKRKAFLQEAIVQINHWRKTEIPKLHQQIEDDERSGVIAALDQQMSS